MPTALWWDDVADMDTDMDTDTGIDMDTDKDTDMHVPPA